MGVCAVLLYRFSAESLLMELEVKTFGKKDGKTGGRRTHDMISPFIWRMPPGQTLGDSTPLLEKASERCGMKKRGGCPQERLYIPPSAKIHNHMHQGATKFE